ncbi:translation initiation factor IF-2 [Spiractinospora alimapuensis]|uniref:translation initiation factor IF-2 n=1 Tax=Spiractinospora alimapuensis TaxID=2820884 RepID=UPI001F4050D7|nr:translation initiation factor IF-2 [Spiractinospora alimapuensis]QVQ53830.1 translation initiation factor IF-2 [Spiractinospora alimapuensis]
MGTSAHPFRTGTMDHHVLAVARSVPAASRLLDVIPLLDSETTKVSYTIPPGSVSERGVERVLREAGVDHITPWAEARRARYGLAMAASPKGGLHRLRARRLLLMPHGAGHNRLVNKRPGDLVVASGLSPRQLTRWGLFGRRIIPSALALPHSEQWRRLHAEDPDLAARVTIVGDPCYDRIQAHQGRRERYRSLLGVGPEQRLVVLSSTWNKESLLGDQREIIRELIATLPTDDYQFALIAHPNVWATEGADQVHRWFTDEKASGMRIVPPEEGWRAALIAADLVVGDHGSVTYYASAIGRPVLLAAFDGDELDSASPLLTYRDMVPSLDPAEPLPPQVLQALKQAPPDATRLLIEHPGSSAERLRDVIYTLLETSPPDDSYFAELPDPPAFAPRPTGWRVDADIDVTVPQMDLRRYPPQSSTPDHTHRRSLVLDREDASHRWQAAEGWSNRTPTEEHPAAEWLVHILRENRRATVAVADTTLGHSLVLDREGRYQRVHSEGLDAAQIAAAAAAWRKERHPWTSWEHGLAVTIGPQKSRLRSTPPPPNLPIFRG